MDIVRGLDAWFLERLTGLQYRPETIAYIAGVLKTLGHPGPEDDMSGRSIVLAYLDAVERGDFVAFQRIGDWVLWSDVVLPGSIKHSREIVHAVGQRSYRSCHRILQGQWALYEELANDLPQIVLHVRSRLV